MKGLVTRATGMGKSDELAYFLPRLGAILPDPHFWRYVRPYSGLTAGVLARGLIINYTSHFEFAHVVRLSM